MKKIPPEIENLMWTLAESGNQQAITEFEGRFPDLKFELSKRISMVRGLRSNRPGASVKPSIPRFNPVPIAPSSPSRAPYTLAIGFALVAVSALTFAFVSNLRRPSIVLAPPQQVTVAPPKLPTAIQTNGLPSSSTIAPESNPASTGQPGLPTHPNPPQTNTIPKWAKTQVVKMRDVPLLTVAKLVGLQGGLSIEIAPGMPNPVIRVDYQDINAVDILKDLGKTYSFTPMLNDDNSVLLIPAVDRSAHLDASLGVTEHH